MTITSGTRRLLVALLVVLSVGLARRADAVTIADIIGLSQAGLSDDVLIALVETDDTVFTLTASQIVQLKTAGVGERVIVAMLWQGRTPVAEPPTVPEAQAAAPDQWSSDSRLETPGTPALIAPSPTTVVVVPAVVPWPIFVSFPQRSFVPRPPPPAAAMPGFGRFMNTGFNQVRPGGFGRFINDGFLDSKPK